MSTQPLPEISDAPKRKRSPHMVPWIVVGAIVVVALIASIIVMNVVRGGSDEPEATAPPSTSEPAPSTSGPDPEEEEEDPDGVPQVDVGDTFPLNVSFWGVTMQVSSRLGGDLSYRIEGENLIFTSSVINQLPESCAAMRSQWGVTRTDSGYEVLKPASRCEEAPELYDQIWGLTAAATESAA